MSYQVLARKYRPKFFREMVGQEHVLQSLIHALDHQRLHHAYLFTGTRGVGKTTTARILAKCLNCETGITSTPCGECTSCVEIGEGRFVDLIEVDAASRTKVEDTRELLDNVPYAPTSGRFKVYLIDEVHMLSTHSFNALLKTLEEPPEHVKFLFATTDPQKVPVTILSRCLQFSMKNMPQDKIVQYLSEILEKETIEFDSGALWYLARAADGSMRDALSLTDQAISHGGGKVVEHTVCSMLGSVDRGRLFGLMAPLNQGNAKALIEAIRALAEYGPDYDDLLANFLSLLHRVGVAQLVPDMVDNSQGDQERILELAQAMTPEDVQLFYQIALNGRKDLPLAPDPQSSFEMTMLRMLAFRPVQRPVIVPPPSFDDQQPAAAAVAHQEPVNKAATEVVVPSDIEGAINHESSGDMSGHDTPVVDKEVSVAEAASGEEREDSVKPIGEPEPGAEVMVAPDVGENLAPTTAEPVNQESDQSHQVTRGDVAASTISTTTSSTSSTSSISNIDSNTHYQSLGHQNPENNELESEKHKSEQKVSSNVAEQPPSIQDQSVDVEKLDVSDKKEHLTPPQEVDSKPGFSNDDWLLLHRSLSLTGMAQNIAANCIVEGWDSAKDGTENGVLLLGANEHYRQLASSSVIQRIVTALSDQLSQAISVQIVETSKDLMTPAGLVAKEKAQRQAMAEQAIENDPNIQTLLNQFDGNIVPGSVTPLEDTHVLHKHNSEEKRE